MHLDSIQALTTDRVAVYLPHGFHGQITGHTKHASVKLSPDLVSRAVLLPSTQVGKNETRQTWIVSPSGVDVAQTVRQSGEDRVWAQTKNASVRFFLEGEKKGTSKEDEEEEEEVWEIVGNVLGNVLGF